MPPGTKSLMILGQDECIFKQYIFTNGVWVLPDGTRELVPKDEGHGVMLSSLCSRELGYGFELSKAILDEVNIKREGKHYSDSTAAKLRNGTSLKPRLTVSPFVRQLEYRNGLEGYWSYEHMVLQIEDCLDVLHVTHPHFDYLFLLDHSNGHDRLQPDGLSLSKINIKFGGKQPKMRDSILTSIHFGPYHTPGMKLQPGCTQSMKFCEDDDGPCYLTLEEIRQQKFDERTGKYKTKELTKSELIVLLKQQSGIKEPRGTKKQFQERCKNLNLSTTTNVQVIKEGWTNKPKGALQVLFERGWIDLSKLSLYTADGNKNHQIAKNDVTGCDYSINALMKLQADFVNEITLLQSHIEKLGSSVDRSPKCHPELAGEGIEYAWALAKLKYRRAAIKDKRTKANFLKLVKTVTCPTDTLSISRIRSCSKRARSYMKLYKSVEEIEKSGGKMEKKHSIYESAVKIYMKLKKISKTHRSVADLHVKDVNEIANETGLKYTISESNLNNKVKEETVSLLVKKMNSM